MKYEFYLENRFIEYVIQISNVIDNIGRILIYKSFTNLRGTEVINLSELSPGIYKLVFYENNNLIETKQFSKVK